MKVVILHDRVTGESREDERDVLVQAQVVSGALLALGYDPECLSFGLDLDSAVDTLERLRPEFVFNLVESVYGHGRLIHLATSMLDVLRIPYTGAPTDGMFATSNKILAKKILAGAGVATPSWISREGGAENLNGGRYIVKSVWEHASIGLDEHSVMEPSSVAQMRRVLEQKRNELGGDAFAEAFIDGREFNLALLAGPGGPCVLSPAEIIFDGYTGGKPQVVGYRAKWDPNSYEYNHTPRRFDFPFEDVALLAELRETALACWGLFSLHGYARVDFRVDGSGRPWVLEVNTNPCLSPDAGFAAALAQSGIDLTEAVTRIVADLNVP